MVKRGQRAGAYGIVSLERLKNELIDLEVDSVRIALRKAGTVWDSGARGERQRWLTRLTRGTEVEVVAALRLILHKHAVAAT